MQSTEPRADVTMPVVGIAVGLVLVILGQFVLDSLADSSNAWHFIQHGVLFFGGIAIGVGGTLLYVRGQRRV